MSIKSQSIAKYNYTGRKRIKQKPELVEVALLERSAQSALVEVNWNRAVILEDLRMDVAADADLILDVLFMGNTRRFELHRNDENAKLRIDDCPDDAILDFRLKLVSTGHEDQGRLLAASSAIKLRSGGGDVSVGQISSGFFHPEMSDNLESEIFVVRWQADDDPKIFVNREYHRRFEKTPAYAAHLFPEIVRRVLTGILLRNDDLDAIEAGSGADDWLLFVHQQLGFQLRGEDAEAAETTSERLELVDRITETFSNRKWRNEKTLLEAVL